MKLNKLYKEILNEELTYRYSDTEGVEDDEFKIGIVKENDEQTIIAYHGSKHRISTFLDDFVGGKDATDQEGPGIYFTTKPEEAIKYAAPDGHVYKVELHPRKMLSNEMNFDLEYLIPSFKKLIKMSPNWKSIVKGYDEGLDEMVYKYLNISQSEKEFFVNLYHDIFTEDPIKFVRGMVYLGYDALFLSSKDSGGHIVVYNPEIIKIVDQKAL